MTTSSRTRGPADPIVFGPEYDPRLDPRSIRFRRPVERCQFTTLRDEMGMLGIVHGTVGRGKTSAQALQRHLMLQARRRDVTISIRERWAPYQAPAAPDFTPSAPPQSSDRA
ncbi:hypothetical protein ACFC0S_16300 [Streptomyces sp. NPDC056084]|uniref:hypothetical protein n=1 Tax=unclassified Streptomyces TaxID=2593676 RepID=UPI0035DB26C3